MCRYLSVSKLPPHFGANHNPFEVKSPTHGSKVSAGGLNTFGKVGGPVGPLRLNTFGKEIGAVVGFQWMNQTMVSRETFSTIMTNTFRVIKCNIHKLTPLNNLVWASSMGKVVASWEVTWTYVKSFGMALLLK